MRMTENNLATLWVYLSTSPLLGLTVTLVSYCIAHAVYLRSGSHPLLNPVLVSVFIIICLLQISGTEYRVYFDGAQFVHFLLGPATVALAIPLVQQFDRIKALWMPIAVSLLFGVVFGSLSAVYISRLLGASLLTQLSLAPKSVTAPVAMGIAEEIGALPTLSAVLVVTTGILGAVLGTRLLTFFRIENDSVKGVAIGVTAHGIGTARAFQVSNEMGAFAGLAMALSTVLTAFLLPWILTALALI